MVFDQAPQQVINIKGLEHALVVVDRSQLNETNRDVTPE